MGVGNLAEQELRAGIDDLDSHGNKMGGRKGLSRPSFPAPFFYRSTY